MEMNLPTEKKAREELIDKAVRGLTKWYCEKLIRDALATDPASPDLGNSASNSDSDKSARLFFEKNFEKQESRSQVESNKMTKVEVDGKTVVTIKHSYAANFTVKEDSEYSSLPPASSGIDVKRRVEAIRAFWGGSPFPAGAPRFDKVLETLEFISI